MLSEKIDTYLRNGNVNVLTRSTMDQEIDKQKVDYQKLAEQKSGMLQENQRLAQQVSTLQQQVRILEEKGNSEFLAKKAKILEKQFETVCESQAELERKYSIAQQQNANLVRQNSVLKLKADDKEKPDKFLSKSSSAVLIPIPNIAVVPAPIKLNPMLLNSQDKHDIMTPSTAVERKPSVDRKQQSKILMEEDTPIPQPIITVATGSIDLVNQNTNFSPTTATEDRAQTSNEAKRVHFTGNNVIHEIPQQQLHHNNSNAASSKSSRRSSSSQSQEPDILIDKGITINKDSQLGTFTYLKMNFMFLFLAFLLLYFILL
jgi:hypothetical protein